VSPSADLDGARLSVLLDLRHPLAYLALHPALRLGASLSVEINWLPSSAPPLNPPTEERADDDRGVRHRRYRAQAIAREIETYGESQGLELRDYYRSDSVDAANLGWLWLRDRDRPLLPAYLGELFRRYWSLEIDASRGESIAALLDAVGANGPRFLAWSRGDGPSLASRIADELRERGLYQVPAYVLDGEVFYGRQHLPMIRWILGGRADPIPI
jgi:2-hydroxychromene-2-carboxylate isomerase